MKLFLSTFLIVASYLGFSQQNIVTLPGITTTKAINGMVFFVATHDQYGTELFVSDGSSGNFKILKDINPGYGGSTPSQFTVFNNQLFFVAYSPDYGMSLWKSDGTSEGTQLVYGVAYSDPYNLMVFKDKLYFTTNLGSIVRTDGTSEGTQLYYQSEYTYGRIRTVVISDQYIYFSLDGRTIFRDDGTSRINFFGPLSWEDVYFRNLFVLENTLVVIKSSTYDNVIRIYSISHDKVGNGQEEDEWVVIKKLDAPIYGTQEIENFTKVSGKLFFSFRTYFDNVPPADELWICDGTEVGTKMLKSFAWSPHSYKSEMGMFFNFQEKLYFRGGDPVYRSLWTSDGTTQGTIKLHDVKITAPYNDERTPVLVTPNKFYFSGSVNDNAELWSSNGTTENTKQILDLEDDGGSTPHDFSFSNDVLYLVTSQQFSATLWSTVPAADISLKGPWGSIIKSGSSPNLFYDVAVGACKTSDVVIMNKGMEELYLGNIVLTGKGFYLVQQSLPEMIPPGGSVTLQIVFNPVSEEKAQATLTILSNDMDEPRYVMHIIATPSVSAPTEICEFPEHEYVKSLEPQESIKPIVLSNYSIAEGLPHGTIVGEFSSPVGATFTLATGEGATDNQHFFIEGNKLKSNTVFYFNSKALYSIRVKAVSLDGEVETSLRIRIINASVNFVEGECEPSFEAMSFTYTSLDANASGHLFATTSNGKILRSKDAGQTWEVVYTGNYVSLYGITFKGNTGYVQSSSFILKSEDDGATWFPLYIPLTGQYYYSGLATFFLNEQEGYVGTGEGEIFFTDDGGHTWSTRLEGSWSEFRDLFFLSKDKGYALIDWGDLYQTNDGGRSWTAVDLSPLGWNTRVRDIWFKDSQNGFMISEYKVFRTFNGGATWIEVPNVGGGDVRTAKFFTNDLGFLYGGNGIIYKTTNGGNSWDMIFPGVWPGQTIGIAQSSGKFLMACGNYYYSYQAARAMAESNDQGTTWSAIHSFGDGNLYNIEFSSNNKGIVLGENGIFKTQDSGLTWNPLVSDLSSIADINFLDENTAILVSAGNIYKSTDGGATTRNVLTTEQGEHYFPAGKLYTFPGNIVFAVSWYAVYRSDDLGETWEMVSTNPGYYTQGMYFVSSSIGYRVELFGSIEKTIDGGETWVEIYTRDPNASKVFNAIFFLNESLGYKGGDFLERTTNGGISWEKVAWPFYEIIAIHFEDEDHGYVVTRGGYVYETKDAGATWEIIFSTSDRIAEVQFRDHNIFMAGEHGFAARMTTTPATPSIPGYIYGPESVCAGDAAEFRLVVVGNNYRTQWNTTAGNFEDSSDNVTISFPDPGEHTITATHFNSCGIGDSRTITVMVSPPPDVPLIDGPNPSTAGQQDVVYTVANPTDDSKFFWEVEGGSGSSAENDGLVIDWATDIDKGGIKVLAVDASGCRAYGALDVELELPLSVESDLLNSVNVYPNPSEGDTKIYSSYQGLLSVRVIDLLGREYSRITLSGGEEQSMKTRPLRSGLYLVEISDGVHTVTKKLIRK